MDRDTAWEVLAAQVALVYGGGPRATVRRGGSWFAVLSGEACAEMNVAGLGPAATAGDAARLAEALSPADGAIVAVASRLSDATLAPLAAAGYVVVGTPDTLMARSPRRLPPVADAPFSVRRSTVEELRRAEPVIVAAHGLAPGVVDRAFNLAALEDGRLGTWIAWADDTPVSVGLMTLEPPIPGVWEMMTDPGYRRRGAARAILTRAMREAVDAAGDAVEALFLWATPAGRPLYDALGFAVIEEIPVWARGLSDEELALLEA
jgi:GNAT superfamily N-acetyltransferase